MNTPESQGTRKPCGFLSAPCYGWCRYLEDDKRVTCACPDGEMLPSGIPTKNCPYKGKTQAEMLACIHRGETDAVLDNMEARIDACVRRMEKIVDALAAALKPIGESHGTQLAG